MNTDTDSDPRDRRTDHERPATVESGPDEWSPPTDGSRPGPIVTGRSTRPTTHPAAEVPDA